MEKVSYTIQEIEESMKDPSCILDSTIRTQFKTIPGRRGSLLHPAGGRFCIAFPMDGNGHRICYRVWKEIIPDAFERYLLIGESLSETRLPYFSGFRFVKKALKMKCDGREVPGMVMDWIDGVTLDCFLSERWMSLNSVEKVRFIRDFYIMCLELHEAGISHGDLSCLNIMVTDENKIRLVDYDGMFVPSMKRLYMQTTGGAESFQHPDRINSRSPLVASPFDDHFSQLVIALSLWTAYFNPEITRKFDETNLLFLPSDFNGSTSEARLRSLTQSDGWKEASRFVSAFGHIKVLMEALKSVGGPYSEVPSLISTVRESAIRASDFYAQLRQSGLSPRFYIANYCTECGHKFANPKIRFCTDCGKERLKVAL